jgi:hypothetical protein
MKNDMMYLISIKQKIWVATPSQRMISLMPQPTSHHSDFQPIKIRQNNHIQTVFGVYIYIYVSEHTHTVYYPISVLSLDHLLIGHWRGSHFL